MTVNDSRRRVLPSHRGSTLVYGPLLQRRDLIRNTGARASVWPTAVFRRDTLIQSKLRCELPPSAHARVASQ